MNFEQIKGGAEKNASFWERLKKSIPNPRAFAAILTMFAVNAMPTSGQKTDDGQIKEKESISKHIDDGIEYLEKLAEVEPKADLYFRFAKQGEGGEIEFNPWALLSPVQLELGYQIPEKEKIKFDLPYKYSRLFNSAEIVDESDKADVQKYIDSALKTELAESILFLDPTDNSKDVYKAQHRIRTEEILKMLESNEVKQIRIIGFTSPEGPKSKNSETLKAENVDDENIELGKKRAEDVDPELRAVLERFGINADQLSTFDSGELQFSDSEFQELVALASRSNIHTDSDLNNVFTLISNYNDGEYANESDISAELDRIVGSKRKVEIEITLKSQDGCTVVIPLPLTLLLLASIPLLKKPRKEKKENEAGLGGRRIFSEKEFGDDYQKLITENQAEFDDVYQRAGEELSPMEKLIMDKRMFVDEIYRYLDDKLSIKKGLDYRKEIESASRWIGQVDAETQKKLIAMRMLAIWELHDREAKIKPYLKAVDYTKDPKKVGWAKTAAKQIFESAEIYHDSPDKLEQAMAEKARELSELCN